jgi:hypothetical protein
VKYMPVLFRTVPRRDRGARRTGTPRDLWYPGQVSGDLP